MNFFTDPQAMGWIGLGSGLLEASGPQRFPVSLGQALGQGMLRGSAANQETARNQLAQAYLGEQLKQAQAARAQQQAMSPILAAFAQRLAGMQQGAPGAAAGPTANPMMPGLPTSSVMAGGPVGAPAQPQAPVGGQGGLPFSIEDIALLKLIGGPDLTSAYNAGKPTDAVRNLQAAGVSPTSEEGRAMIAGPAYSEMIKMRNQPAEVLIPGTQIKVPTTQAVANAFNTGVAPDDTTAMQAMLIASRHGITKSVGVGHLPELTSGGPMTAPPKPLSTSQAEALTTSARTAAEGDTKRVLDLEAKIPSMLSVIRRLDRMEGLTADDQTYAAAGAELKTTLGSIAQAFGLQVKKEKTANTEEYLAHVAELLKDRLASKDYGSGTGISNLDLLAARAPLPELAKTANGRQQIIAALRTDTERNLKDAQAARDYFDANNGLRGFRFPSEIAAEQDRRTRELPKTPGTPPGGAGLPKGVTVKRLR